jgi:predicted TIM-barrel fold metal-dependent hydrolase
VDRRTFLAGGAAGLTLAGANVSAGTLKSSRPIVIDAHSHLGYMGSFGMRDISFEETLDAADEAGIDKLCVCSVESLFFDTESGNESVYRIMKKYPKRVIGFASISSPYFGKKGIEQIQKAVEVYGMKGIGELETNPSFQIDIPQWIAILEKSVDLKVPVLVHAPPGPCARAAERVPEATLILAHIGTGHGITATEWLDSIEMAKKHSNVYLETCTSITSYGQIEMAIREVGAERLVFGSDSPMLDPSVQKAKITGGYPGRGPIENIGPEHGEDPQDLCYRLENEGICSKFRLRYENERCIDEANRSTDAKLGAYALTSYAGPGASLIFGAWRRGGTNDETKTVSHWSGNGSNLGGDREFGGS